MWPYSANHRPQRAPLIGGLQLGFKWFDLGPLVSVALPGWTCKHRFLQSTLPRWWDWGDFGVWTVETLRPGVLRWLLPLSWIVLHSSSLCSIYWNDIQTSLLDYCDFIGLWITQFIAMDSFTDLWMYRENWGLHVIGSPNIHPNRLVLSCLTSFDCPFICEHLCVCVKIIFVYLAEIVLPLTMDPKSKHPFLSGDNRTEPCSWSVRVVFWDMTFGVLILVLTTWLLEKKFWL